MPKLYVMWRHSGKHHVAYVQGPRKASPLSRGEWVAVKTTYNFGHQVEG